MTRSLAGRAAGAAGRSRSATHILAEFATSTRYEDLPPAVVRESKRCIADYLGVAIGAAREPAPVIALAQVRALGGNAQARVLVHGDRTNVLNAALVNGIMSHVLDFDDTHIPTILHATGPIVSAALAIAEARNCSGRALLAAHAVAFEVSARIALALFPAHYDAGWHMTGTAGTLGGATAAAQLMALDHGQMTHAFGIAATQAAGHREQFGAMTKSLHVGKAASSGILAALLAERGYLAAADSLAGRRGMLHVMSGESHAERLTDGLGEGWEIFRNGFKPYACGVVSHAGIDAVRALRTRIEVEDVAEIQLRVHPLAIELTSKPAPATGLEGKFSLAFAAAIAFLDGAARQRQFTDANVCRPDVTALRDRIALVADPQIGSGEAVAVARLHDRREITSEIKAASGTPANPMSDADIREKLLDLVGPIIGQAAGEQIYDLVDRLDTLETVTPIMDLATGQASMEQD